MTMELPSQSRGWQNRLRRSFSAHITFARARGIGIVAAVAIGIAAALVLLGPTRINPTNTGWISGDFVTVQIGWDYYRNDTSFLPPASSRSMEPLPVNIAMYDALPLVSFVLKPFSPLLPDNFQFIGGYLLLSIVLQAVFAFLLFFEYAGRRHPARTALTFGIIATVFIALSPVLLWRWRGHAALSSHWLVIAAFWLLLQSDKVSTTRTVIGFAVLFAIAGGINPYILVMVAIVFLGFLIKALRAGRIDLLQLIPALAVLTFTGIASLMIFGFLILGMGGALPGGGYGYYSANLLSLIDPGQGRSTFLPKLPTLEGQYEGYGYLGLGAIAMLIAGLFAAAREGRSTSQNLNAFILILGVGFLLALSTRVTAGTRILFDIGLPGFMMHVLEIFRSSGRFIWLTHYGLIIAAAILLARFLPTRWLVLAAGAFLFLQMVDLAPSYEEFGRVNKRPAPRFAEPVWNQLAPTHRTLVVIPPFQCDPIKTPVGVYGYVRLGHVLLEQKLTTNSSYTGRVPRNQAAYHCRDFMGNFRSQPVRRDAAYLFSNDSFAELGQQVLKTHECDLADGLVLCRVTGIAGLGPLLAASRERVTVREGSIVTPADPRFPAMQFGWQHSAAGWHIAQRAAGIEVISGFDGDAPLELRIFATREASGILPPQFLEVYVAGAYLGYLAADAQAGLSEKSFLVPVALVPKDGRFRVTLLDRSTGFEAQPAASRLRLARIEFNRSPQRSDFPALRVVMNSQVNDRTLLVEGWSTPEPWGVWNDGEFALLRVPRPAGSSAFNVDLEVVAFAYPRRGLHEQRLEVELEGSTIFRGSIKPGGARLTLSLPESTVAGATSALLRFKFPDAFPMDELPNSLDRRRLALGIRSMLVQACETHRCETSR